MAVQNLAEAAIILRGDLSRLDDDARRGGRTAGQTAGDELVRGIDGKLRNSRGQFVRSGQALGASVGEGTNRGFLARIRGVFETSGSTAAKNFAKGFGNDSGTFSRVIATMAAKVTIASAALALAAPGVAQLTAALIPATGAAVALPAALLAGKVAAGVFRVAVMGVGDAITKGFTGTAKQAKAALEELPPSARRFAASVIALKPRIDALRASVATRFFRPLQDDVRPLAERYFPILQRQMPALAGSMGRFGSSVAVAARQSSTMRAVNALFDGTRGAVDRARGAVNPLTKALSALITATAPLLPRIASGFVSIATQASNYVTKASQSGRVVEIWNNSIRTLRTLGQIVGNVGAIIGTVWRQSDAAGVNLLTRIRDLTGQARAFVQSGQGMSAIAATFRLMASLGDSLRTGLGAALPAIAKSVQIAAPALARFAQAAADLVVQLAPLLPHVTQLAVQVLTALLPAIISLTGWMQRNQSTVQQLAPVIVGLVTAMYAYRAALVVSAAATRVWSVAVGAAKVAQAGWTAVSWLASAPVHAHTAAMKLSTSTLGTWVGVKSIEARAWLSSTAASAKDTASKVANRVATMASATATGVHTAATKVSAAATTAWAAITAGATAVAKAARVATLALWTAMKANPIGAVITIITLLVGAFVYAYKNSETFRRIVDNTWRWIKRAAETAWNWMKGTLWPGIQKAISNAQNQFRMLQGAVSAAWRFIHSQIMMRWNLLKAIFNGIRTVITQTLPNAFRTGVAAIARFWLGLQQAARKPVSFVVNSVINPFLGGFQKIAGVFGVKTPDPIKGFAKGGNLDAEGGQIPGVASSRDNRIAWLKNGAGKVISNVAVATGEFVVNARDTAKALPLLRWINDGMKGGPTEIVRRLGRRPVEKAGDGSEGFAFAKGGLLGFFGDVWDVISNPAKLVRKPFDAALGKIPGGGMVKDLLVGMGKKLIGGVMDFITGGGGGVISGGNVGKAQAFIRAQAGKPYGWANAGPGSYDCSGIVSAAYNVLKGQNPYRHTFSTGQLPGRWFNEGQRVGALVAGWAHPGQRGASANVGHMAGSIGGMPFESTGSRGVRIGFNARKVTQFAHIGAARAMGGLLDMQKVAKSTAADTGRLTLAPGQNLVWNGLGRQEHMVQTATPDGPMRLDPRDLEALAKIFAREVAAAVGASNYAMGRQTSIYVRGG